MFNAGQNASEGGNQSSNKLGVPINLSMEVSRSYSSGIDASSTKPSNNRLRVHDSELPQAACFKVRSNPTSPHRGSKSQYLTRMHKKWSNRALHASSSSEHDPSGNQHIRQQSSNISTDSNNCDQLDIPGANSDTHIDPNSRLSLSQQHLLLSPHSSPLLIHQSSSCHNLNPNQSHSSTVMIGPHNSANHLTASVITNPSHLFQSSSLSNFYSNHRNRTHNLQNHSHHHHQNSSSTNFLVKQFAIEDETQPPITTDSTAHRHRQKMLQLKQNNFVHHNHQTSSLEINPRSSSFHHANSDEPQNSFNQSVISSSLFRHSTRSLANHIGSIGSSNAPINFKKALRDRWYYSNSQRHHPHHQNSSTNTTFSSTNSSSFTQNPNLSSINANGYNNNNPSSFSESEDNNTNSRLKILHNYPSSSVTDSVDNNQEVLPLLLPINSGNHDYQFGSTLEQVSKDTMEGANNNNNNNKVLQESDINSGGGDGGHFKIKTSLSLDLLHLNNPNKKYRLQSTNSTISSVSGVEPEDDPFSPATTATDICSPLLRLNIPNLQQHHQSRFFNTNTTATNTTPNQSPASVHCFSDGSNQSKLTMSLSTNRNEARQFFPDNVPLTEHLEISSLATNSASSLSLLGVPHSSSVSSNNNSMNYFRNNRGFTSLTTSPVRASNGCHDDEYRLSQLDNLDNRPNGTTSSNHLFINSRSMDCIGQSDDNPPLLTPEVYPIGKKDQSKSSIKKGNVNAAAAASSSRKLLSQSHSRTSSATISSGTDHHQQRRPSKMRQRSYTLPASSMAVSSGRATMSVYSQAAVSPTSSASTVRKCEVCGRIFSRSDMLARHSRVHTGLRPFVCPVCDQSFSRSDHLGTHMRIHSGEKPYRCSLCDYSACRRDMITRHLRVHRRKGDITGEFSPNSLVVHNSCKSTRRRRYKLHHHQNHHHNSQNQDPTTTTISSNNNVSPDLTISRSSVMLHQHQQSGSSPASSSFSTDTKPMKQMGPFMALLDGTGACGVRDDGGHDNEDVDDGVDDNDDDERPTDMVGMPFGNIFISICQPTPRSSFSVPTDQNLS